MAQYSELSARQISELLDEYAVGHLDSYKVLSGGSENTNYLVTTTQNQFVLTLCEQKSFAETHDLAKLLQHLAKHHFFTTVIIPNKYHEFVTACQNKPVLLKTFIEGNIIEDLPLTTLHGLGKQLAQLHHIPAPETLPRQVTFGKESFTDIEKYANGSPFQAWLYGIREQVNALLVTTLPKALIHSDIFFDNIVVSSNFKTATIMDFEEAAYYYRVFDIGMMLVGACSENNELNLNKSRTVLTGYLGATELQKEERNALQTFCAYAAAATGYWRHKQFNYIMPSAEMSNHYQAMVALADQILAIDNVVFSSIFDFETG